MGKRTVDELTLKAMADKIRSKKNITGDILFPDEYLAAYDEINNGIIPEGTIKIETNGDHDVTNFSNAQVNVPIGVFPSEIINIFSNVSGMDITNGKTLNVNVPTGIVPTGNLTDALITRSSYIDANTGSGQHVATIPAGYYVNSAFTISEWKTGLINGNGSSGGIYNVPYSSVGFTPVYALLIALGISNDNAANTVIAAYGNNASAYSAMYVYAGAKASLSKSYPINGTYNTVTFNSSGITFAGLSGVKYGSFSYRWFALR